MTVEPRGVTRGYVWGLLLATLIIAAALVVVTWGMYSLLSGRPPVETDGVARWVSPVGVVVAIGVLAWGLWQQALVLLRGQRTPSWAYVVVLAGLAYLVWCFIGMLGGLSISETWLSPYALLLAPIWAISSLIFWAVLARRVYTNRSTPKWPWEDRENDGPEAPGQGE